MVPLAAQHGDAPQADQPTGAAPTTTTPRKPSNEGRSSVDVPPADTSPAFEPAPARPSAPNGGGGGGGLPHTGFALAALVALGTGFVLTGYALTLRYSRAVDG